MDFSQFKTEGRVNSKQSTTPTKKKKVSSSIRTTEEEPKVKAKPLDKNFNISMYKQVYQYCDGCKIETVQYFNEGCANCMYCKSKTAYAEYINPTRVIVQQNSFDPNKFIWL